MSEWKYNMPWRPNYEAFEVAGWSAGIASALAVNAYFDMPSLPCYMAVTVQAAYGIRALPEAYYVYKHKRRLAKKPDVLIMRIEEIIDAMIKYPDSYIFGKGFQWGQKEGQSAFELLKRDLSKLAAKTDDNFMGLGWIHQVGSDSDYVRTVEDLLSLHTLITGTTGSGKTTYYKLIILQAALKGQPLIMVDPKNDEGLAKWMEMCLSFVGRAHKLNYFSLAHPEKSVRISPITNFTRSGEVANRIISVIQRSDSTSDPFISFATMSLTSILEMMKMCEIKPTLKSLKTQLGSNITALAELVTHAITKVGREVMPESWFDSMLAARKSRLKSVDAVSIAKICSELYMSDIRQNKAFPDIEAGIDTLSHNREHFQKMILNVMPILSQLTTGFMGDLLSPDTFDPDQLEDDRPIANIREIISTNGMLYLGLDALADGDTASAVGSIFLSDITSVASEIYNFMQPRGEDVANVMILVDEAAEVVNDQVIKMLNKSRGAGFCMFIASQGTSDFEARLGSEAKMEQIIVNTNHFTALRTPSPKAQKAIMERVPLTKFKYIMRGHGSSAGADPEQITGSVGERLMEEESELFPAPLLGWLPNLEFFALNQAKVIVKGKVPILSKPKNQKEIDRIKAKAARFQKIYKEKVRGERVRSKSAQA
ncbi:conjugative transfer system coupling protein TraD (plasmid) [Klebsiella pneumoniae]|uniref:conjugative transfer system coupling protein TraD n=1 Tax=Klebsiella pneumoniae TaxID=573 RepID=UPI001FADAE25|nr:conjugative transfer system coupling protein TraD [Klebsiella pneumoniae]MCI8109139.1 conjugative transfer system coupling protein TraD [Klebsiella pneumoniae]